MPNPTTLAVLVGVGLLAGATVWLLYQAYTAWQEGREVRGQLERISRQGSPRPSSREAPGAQGDRETPEWLQRLVAQVPHVKDLEHLLEQANSRWNVAAFLGMTLGLASTTALLVFFLLQNVWGAGVAGVAVAFLPYLVVRRKRSKRIEEFEEHFPDAIDLLNRSIRAGHAFSTGLQVVAEESPQPVSNEFRQVFEEQKYGLPLRDSLLALGDRIDTVDVRMFVTSVLIQRESGGNLAENLENLANLVRARFQFERDVKTKTAHGRITGLVLGLAPIGAGIGMTLIAPDYMAPLWEQDIGRLILLGTAIWMGIGFLWIRKLVDLDY